MASSEPYSATVSPTTVYEDLILYSSSPFHMLLTYLDIILGIYTQKSISNQSGKHQVGLVI